MRGCDALLAIGSPGSPANWYARRLTHRPGMRSSLSGSLATMGPCR